MTNSNMTFTGPRDPNYIIHIARMLRGQRTRRRSSKCKLSAYDKNTLTTENLTAYSARQARIHFDTGLDYRTGPRRGQQLADARTWHPGGVVK